MKSDVEFIIDENRIRPENSEVFRLCCDNTRINELTGFQPEYVEIWKVMFIKTIQGSDPNLPALKNFSLDNIFL